MIFDYIKDYLRDKEYTKLMKENVITAVHFEELLCAKCKKANSCGLPVVKYWCEELEE